MSVCVVWTHSHSLLGMPDEDPELSVVLTMTSGSGEEEEVWVWVWVCGWPVGVLILTY